MSCGSAYDSFLNILCVLEKNMYPEDLGYSVLYTSVRSICFYPKSFIFVFILLWRLLLHIFAQIITSLYSSLCLQIIFLERSSLTTQSQIGFISHFLYPVLFSLKHYLYLPSHYISVCLLSISLIVINTYWGKEFFCLVFCAITSTWKALYTKCSINMFWMIKQMN